MQAKTAAAPVPASYRTVLLGSLREAGGILLRYHGRVKAVRHKEHPSSVVCEADLAAEQHVIRRIRKAFPADSIIAEESGFTRGTSEYTWVIDPLDGTSNFVAGLPWFGVQAGVLRGNTPVLAAMFLPIPGAMYEAALGEGAWKNGRRLQIRTQSKLRNVLCAFGFDAGGGPGRVRRSAQLLMRVGATVRNTRATNSLIDFCYTLDGGFGACINLNCKIWDIVPISLILLEAGGRFTDLKGKEIEFILDEKSGQRSYEVLGTSKGLHQSLVRAIRGN